MKNKQASNHKYPQLLDYCQTCKKSNLRITPSHLVKEKHVHSSWDYDYKDPANYMSECLPCHMEYENLNDKKKFGFDNETRHEYLRERGLWELAARIDRLISQK